MQRSEVLQALRAYVVNDVLDGRDVGLDETTPLLEWGIVNSLEIVKMLNFFQERFQVEIPPDQIVADYFQDLNALTDLVLSQMTSVTSCS